MKITFNNATGFMIESQADKADDETMLKNAINAGFNDVSIRIVTDEEHEALIDARDAAQAV